MKDPVLWIQNTAPNRAPSKADLGLFSPSVVESVIDFHASFPQYAVTPLHSLRSLAQMLGVSNIWVKDESHRFQLNAFKALGGSYAMGKYLSEKMGAHDRLLSYTELQSPEVAARVGRPTFITATDGNHGRGIAWTARQLGYKAVIYMPKGSTQARLKHIQDLGADAHITECNYDDTVRMASEDAAKNGWVLMQDTAWEGYEVISTWIMQGYMTVMHETLKQLKAQGEELPTHVFLQAGVGSFAGAMLGNLVATLGEQCPLAVVVEPSKAACLFASNKVGDGKPHAVTGDLATIMAGLACGEPSTVSWPVLRDYTSMFFSCPDYVAARGMRMLSSPLDGDPRIISGESGAVGLGLLSLLAQDKALNDARLAMRIDSTSKILLISTEGDTDACGYLDVVWNGAHPMP